MTWFPLLTIHKYSSEWMKDTQITRINVQKPFFIRLSICLQKEMNWNGINLPTGQIQWVSLKYQATTILISFPLRRSPVSYMSGAHKCRIPFNENDTHCNNMKTGRLPLCYVSIGISVCNTEGAMLFVTVFVIVCRIHYVYTTSIDFSAPRKFLWLETNGIKENVRVLCASRLLFKEITQQQHTVERLPFILCSNMESGEWWRPWGMGNVSIFRCRTCLLHDALFIDSFIFYLNFTIFFSPTLLKKRFLPRKPPSQMSDSDINMIIQLYSKQSAFFNKRKVSARDEWWNTYPFSILFSMVHEST